MSAEAERYPFGPPADAEFLELLFRTLSSESYVRWQTQVMGSLKFEERFPVWVAEGAMGEDQIDSARSLHAELVSLKDGYHGQFIRALKDYALSMAGPDRPALEDIAVVMLPTGGLNARVFASPEGGTAVVLNHGVLISLQFIVRTLLAFITWHDEKPFCRDASQEDYAHALVGLARYVAGSDMRVFEKYGASLRFPSLSPFDQTTISLSVMTEIFMLLHEYGHLVLGHLKRPLIVASRVEATPAVAEFNQAQLDEFDADAYATTRMLEAVEGQMTASDVALAAGILLRFFSLCERLQGRDPPAATSSHPSAASRWERVKAATELARYRGSLASTLDGAFEEIERRVLGEAGIRGESA